MRKNLHGKILRGEPKKWYLNIVSKSCPYQIKHFWVPCYLRGYFFGGMTTTGRSESINVFIKQFVNSRLSLIQFVKQVRHYLPL